MSIDSKLQFKSHCHLFFQQHDKDRYYFWYCIISTSTHFPCCICATDTLHVRYVHMVLSSCFKPIPINLNFSVCPPMYWQSLPDAVCTVHRKCMFSFSVEPWVSITQCSLSVWQQTSEKDILVFYCERPWKSCVFIEDVEHLLLLSYWKAFYPVIGGRVARSVSDKSTSVFS